MPVEIVALSMADYEDVLALWKLCPGISVSEADSRPNLAAYLERNPGMSFAARDGKKIIGAVLCGHDGRRGYLHHLAVHAAYRRQGIARRLTDACLAAVERLGFEKCHCFVFNDNAGGMDYWSRAGWMRRTDMTVFTRNLGRGASVVRKGPNC